jgi:hypothetical protein
LTIENMGDKLLISTFSGTLEGYDRVNSEKWAERQIVRRLGDSAVFLDGFEFSPGHFTRTREVVVFENARTGVATANIHVEIGDKVMFINMDVTDLEQEFTVIKSLDFLSRATYEKQRASRERILHSKTHLSEDFIEHYMADAVDPSWAYERSRSQFPLEVYGQFGANFMGNLPPTSIVIMQPSTDGRAVMYEKMIAEANRLREILANECDLPFIPIEMDESIQSEERKSGRTASAGAD